MEIIARGWSWKRSDKPTAWMGVKCVDCNNIMTYPSNTYYGTHCKKCHGVDMPIGYVRKYEQVPNED